MRTEPRITVGDETLPQGAWYECQRCHHEARPSAFGMNDTVEKYGYIEVDPPAQPDA